MKIKSQKNRDYALHEPALRHLLGTLENYGQHLDKERQARLEALVNKQNPVKKVEERPKSAFFARKREYPLHEPRFLDLQLNFLKYFQRPSTAGQTKDEKRRRARLEKAIQRRKNKIIEKRQSVIEDLEEQLEEILEEEVDEMTNLEKMEHEKKIQNLKNRILREKENLGYGILPMKEKKIKPEKLEVVLEWNNPPKYDRAAPQSRHIMQVSKQHGPYFDGKRKAILDRHVEKSRANEQEYAAWKRQIRQNVAEKLRNEGVTVQQPVKLQPKDALPSPLPRIKSRVHGKAPEYTLPEPGFRYLANTEQHYLQFLRDEARHEFCTRFKKAQEIELRKQEKRERRIERARQALLQRQKTTTPSPKEFPNQHEWQNISRDYVQHEPLFRYIENVKLNFYDYLTPRQRRRIDRKYEEMRKQRKAKEREEKYCQAFPKNCQKAIDEEIKPDPELNWVPRTGYVLHEPLFRYYEDFKEKYLHLLKEKQRKAFMTKYKEAKAKEDEKKKKKQINEPEEDQNQSEDLPPVTPRTDYDLYAPGFRFVQNTAENYEPYLGEKFKEPFLQRYKMMKEAEKERLEKLSKREKAAQGDDETKESVAENNDKYDPQRNYDLADPRFNHLYATWMQFKHKIPEERKEYVENLLKKLSTHAETTQKTHEKRCEYAMSVRCENKPQKTKENDEIESPEERKDRIARLATPNTRQLETTYASYKDVMDKDMAKRIKETLDRENLMSMEEMEKQLADEKQKARERLRRIKLRKENRQKVLCKLQYEAYKQILAKLLQKLSQGLPKKILYSPAEVNLTCEQLKIYKTALWNLNDTHGITGSSHLHGLTMQIVEFFDAFLN
ncbi:trichohyalin-like [Culicoides brevitarsis]|uniref:trichohyalin-like n=1 Tax=Culicoides brevitarsis TaxID=469753 RepID=UPI00307B425B